MTGAERRGVRYMAYTDYLDKTVHHLRSEIGNLLQRSYELESRMREMKMAIAVMESTAKPGDEIIDKDGRVAIVSISERYPTRLMAFLKKRDGSVGKKEVYLYSSDKWRLVEK